MSETGDPLATMRLLTAAAVQARFEHATEEHRRGKLVDAERSYREVLLQQPDHFDALHRLGIIAAQTGQTEQAVVLFERATRLDATVANAHSNLGSAQLELGRPAAALASYDRAIALTPGEADLHNSRGIALRDLGRFKEALASYSRAIALRPDYAEAYYNQANVLQILARLAEASESLNRVIALWPDFAEAYVERGNILQNMLRFQDALADYDKAVSLRPDSPVANSNRGNVLQQLGHFEEALASYDRAIVIKPSYAEAYCNRGLVMEELQRYEDALASYDKAISLKPDDVDAHRNQSFCLLHMGRFEQGWRLFEWRHLLEEGASRSFRQPLWLGDESVVGKKLFVHWEQGLGDTLQFCRYGRLVEELGANVIMSVQQPLQRLLKQMSSTIEIVGPHELPSDFDYHCPLLSLPLALKTTVETIPAEPGYLKADSDMRGVWKNRIPSNGKPRIGVVWSGGTGFRKDHRRSVELERLFPIFEPDFNWICLQKEIRQRDVASFQRLPNVAFFGDYLADFSDTAALLDLMDLIITTDTSVAHLAGAMGKPTWILLGYNPDWRWLMQRDDCPWYPSVRLFRQQQPGDWEGVATRVKDELRLKLG